MADELTEHPSGLKLTRELNSLPWDSFAINGYGEIVVSEYFSVTVISKTGERKKVELPATYRECEVVEQFIRAVAVDKNNNVYIVKWLKIRTVNSDEERLNMLYILDVNYSVKQEHKLDFLEVKNKYDDVKIAINKNNDIVMSKEGAPEVIVYDIRGNLKHKFKQESLNRLRRLSISNKNEIMVSSKYCRAVYIYSEEGNLKSTVNLPEGHWLCGMAFHFVYGKLIVMTEKKHSYFILCYTEEGELETTTYFCKDGSHEIMSHPSGPIAVLDHRSITFI